MLIKYNVIYTPMLQAILYMYMLAREGGEGQRETVLSHTHANQMSNLISSCSMARSIADIPTIPQLPSFDHAYQPVTASRLPATKYLVRNRTYTFKPLCYVHAYYTHTYIRVHTYLLACSINLLYNFYASISPPTLMKYSVG